MKYNKIVRVFSIIIVLSLLLFAIPASPAQAAREVVLDPEEGSIGETIEVAGTDFNKSTEEYDRYATIYFSSEEASTLDDIDDDVTVYEIVKDGLWLDEDGAFETTFKVPAELDDGDDEEDVVTGTYYVYVCHYGYPDIRAYAEFVVTGGEIEIDPEEGPVATEVEITGTEFSSSKDINIEYDGEEVDIESGDDETDNDGEFTSSILIPESTAGDHTITVIVSGSEVEVEFAVEPEIILSPTSGEADTEVTVSGTGFGRRNEVLVYFNSAGMATVTVDSDGSFEATFNVPELDAGIYDVEAEDDDENLDSAKFTITVPSAPSPAPSPSPTPSPAPSPAPSPTNVNIKPTSGQVGTYISISGTGFEANAEVSVKYDDKELSTAPTDEYGLFISLLEIPTSKSGDHTITISDGTNTEEITFTVESVPPPIPTPVLPQMGVKVKMPVSFDWQDVTADSPPVTYTLQVATDNKFTVSSILLQKTELIRSEYTITEDEAVRMIGQEAPYYWRVRAIDAASNEGDWTGAGEFHVSTSFSLPSWVIYTLLGLGGLVLFGIGYWMGRRTAYYY